MGKLTSIYKLRITITSNTNNPNNNTDPITEIDKKIEEIKKEIDTDSETLKKLDEVFLNELVQMIEIVNEKKKKNL